MKIYLVGMPGSGKTTLGRHLASELLLLFTDLDKEIERKEGKSIADIFSQQGEDYFRQVESSLLVSGRRQQRVLSWQPGEEHLAFLKAWM